MDFDFVLGVFFSCFGVLVVWIGLDLVGIVVLFALWLRLVGCLVYCLCTWVEFSICVCCWFAIYVVWVLVSCGVSLMIACFV